jgi:hypothetical protein
LKCFVKPHYSLTYNSSENYWIEQIKLYQNLQSHTDFSMSFIEYMNLPLFAMRYFEKVILEIKEEKDKIYKNLH